MRSLLKTVLLFCLAFAQIAGAVAKLPTQFCSSPKMIHACKMACCKTVCHCVEKKSPLVPLPDQNQNGVPELSISFEAVPVNSSIEFSFPTYREDFQHFPACIESIFAHAPPPEFHLPLRI